VPDSDESLKVSFNEDIKHWKVDSLLPAIKLKDDCTAVLRLHFKALKKIFTVFASRSHEYPCIDWPQYLEFCNESKINTALTDQEIKMAFLDTKFSSSVSELNLALNRC
jgi:hypothetical protein